MRLPQTLLALSFLSISASAISAPSGNNNSCTRVPVIRQNENEIIPDKYEVVLYQNHTLEDHYRRIGLNLSEVASEFFHFPESKGYFITVNSTIMNDFIRCDPGVEHVEHEEYFDWSQFETSTPVLPELNSSSLQTPASNRTFESEKPDNGSCSRVPLIKNPFSSIVPDRYSVGLYPNHTLEDHYKRIGLNLSEIAGGRFYYFEPPIHGYYVTVNSTVINDLIRCDSGVKYVQYEIWIDMSQLPTPIHSWTDSFDRELPNNFSSLRTRAARRMSESEELPDEAESSDDSTPRRTWEMDRIPAEWPNQMITAGKKINVEKFHRPKPYISTIAEAGKGVNVYILDTGIRISHVAFKGRATNFQNRTTSPYQVNLTTGVEDTMEDQQGHGTHVAAILGGEYYGVASSANIINVKIFGVNVIQSNDVVRAIDDVTNEHKAHLEKAPFEGWRGSVINLSMTFGLYQNPVGLEAALKRAYNTGITIVAAAGNYGLPAKHFYPCNYDFVVCVGATDYQYKMFDKCPEMCKGQSYASNYGSPVDIFAPGKNVLSAFNSSDVSWATMSGTSMASPMVAGVLAMIVGHEGLRENSSSSDRAKMLLFQNKLEGVVEPYRSVSVIADNQPTFSLRQLFKQTYPIDKSPSTFLDTGIQNPNKDPEDPYFIPDEYDIADVTAAQNPETITVTGATLTSTISPTITWSASAELAADEWDHMEFTLSSYESPTGSLNMPTSTMSPTTTPTGTFSDLKPSLCVGNQVQSSSCIAGVLPSATPYSGTKQPVCYKADGEAGTFPRINATQASVAATEYCEILIKNGWVLSEHQIGAIPYVKSGAAENGSDVILSVKFDINACPSDQATSVVDFKALGQERCWQNLFYELSVVCAQTPQWAKYNPEFTLEGGVFAANCGLWSLGAGDEESKYMAPSVTSVPVAKPSTTSSAKPSSTTYTYTWDNGFEKGSFTEVGPVLPSLVMGGS